MSLESVDCMDCDVSVVGELSVVAVDDGSISESLLFVDGTAVTEKCIASCSRIVGSSDPPIPEAVNDELRFIVRFIDR